MAVHSRAPRRAPLGQRTFFEYDQRSRSSTSLRASGAKLKVRNLEPAQMSARPSAVSESVAVVLGVRTENAS